MAHAGKPALKQGVWLEKTRFILLYAKV